MESPWDETPKFINTQQEAEWSRMSSEFTNAGYREGITSGKESSLQEGFDTGFADVGAPIGRELGLLRGLASAILGFLDKTDTDLPLTADVKEWMVPEARNIYLQLSRIRFTDLMPPDIEAEQHSQHHDSPQDLNEELKEKQNVEHLADMLERMSAGTSKTTTTSRPSIEYLQALKAQLKALADATGLGIDFT